MSIKLLKKIIKQQKVNTNIFILKSYDLTLKQRIKIMLINNNLSIKNQIMVKSYWIKTSITYNKYEIF